MRRLISLFSIFGFSSSGMLLSITMVLVFNKGAIKAKLFRRNFIFPLLSFPCLENLILNMEFNILLDNNQIIIIIDLLI